MGVAMAGTAAVVTRPILSPAEPDIVVVNARIYTMDPRLPRADAFAVSNGKFAAVGSTSEMRSLARRRTRVMDEKRMTIVPGFISCVSSTVSGSSEAKPSNAGAVVFSFALGIATVAVPLLALRAGYSAAQIGAITAVSAVA